MVLRLPSLRAPLGATSQDDAGRTQRNLDFTELPNDLIKWLEKLDAWCISTATKNAAKLFKRQKSESRV